MLHAGSVVGVAVGYIGWLGDCPLDGANLLVQFGARYFDRAGVLLADL